MLVEQEAGKHAKLHVPNCKCDSSELGNPSRHVSRHVSCRVKQLVGRARQHAGGDGWHVHDLRPLSAIHGRIVVGQPIEHVWRDRWCEDQADWL